MDALEEEEEKLASSFEQELFDFSNIHTHRGGPRRRLHLLRHRWPSNHLTEELRRRALRPDRREELLSSTDQRCSFKFKFIRILHPGSAHETREHRLHIDTLPQRIGQLTDVYVCAVYCE